MIDDAPDADGHRRQIEGIANRHVAPSAPARPRQDYDALADALRHRPVVECVDILLTGDEPTVECLVDGQRIPPSVMDVLRTHGFSIDPDRTATQGDMTVVVARD